MSEFGDALGEMDAFGALFNPKKRIRELSSSVVVHDRFDDGVLDDFIDRAANFRRVIEEAPTVIPTVPAPNEDDYEDEDDYARALEGALLQQERADELAENYHGWAHDVKDVFRAYHTWDEPKVKQPQEIKPSRQLGRELMQRQLQEESFSGARPHTRHSDVEAAMSTMVYADKMREHLETTLAEHVSKAQEANEQEDTLDQAERSLDNLQQMADEQMANGGQVDQDLAQQMLEAAQAQKQASQALQQTAQQIASMGTSEIAQAVREASEEAEDAAEMMAAMPGHEPGTPSNIDPQQAFELADKWRNNPRLKRIAELVGKLKRDFRFARANRVVGGREEVTDIEFGAEIERILPIEITKLAHPLMKLDFLRRFADRGLMQWEMVGTEEAGQGPAIFCIDGSGSMGGDLGGATRNEYARAIALSMLSGIHGERRDVGIIEYGYGDGEVKTWFFPGNRPIDAFLVAEVASHWFGGGTDTTLALDAANTIIMNAHAFKTADVLLLSDGEDTMSADDHEVLASFKSKGVRVQGISVGEHKLPYLTEVCDHVISVLDLAQGNEAVKDMAAHMT